jgi:hypothetical protein
MIEPDNRFNKRDNTSLFINYPLLSFVLLAILLFTGCSANYQGPLRFSSNSHGQNYQNAYNGYKSSNRQITKSIDYKVDTLIVIDTIVGEYPLEIIERSNQEKEYESCPVIFDTITTGDLLTEAIIRLSKYFSEIIGGNPLYKYVVTKFLKILEIYLPDIFDRILEIFNLDELIEKQRYPEVYIYQRAFNSTGPEEFSYGIRLANYVSVQNQDINYLSSERIQSLSSEKPDTRRGLDIVQ